MCLRVTTNSCRTASKYIYFGSLVVSEILWLLLDVQHAKGDIPKVKLYTPSDPKLNAGITVYGVEGYNGAQLQDAMWKARLRPRSSAGIGLRQSTHIFNSTEEIDRSLRVVRELAKA